MAKKGGLEVAGGLAHLVHALRDIIKAFMQGGWTAAAMRAFKHYWPQIFAIALVLLLLPVIIFCCLPMMLFGFPSSTDTKISSMTVNAQTVSEYYDDYESYIDEWVEEIKSTVTDEEEHDTKTEGTSAEPEQTEQIEYEVVLSGAKIQKNWFIALHAVTVGNDLNAVTEADIRSFSRKCVTYTVKPADENTENESGNTESASDDSDSTKMILDIRYLTPSEIMAEAGFIDADENWAQLIYNTLEGDLTAAST